MPRRHRTEETEVTLFPFLAVLVCTMGILIVLLVVAVKAADTQASTRAEEWEQKEQQLDDLTLRIEEEQLRNQTLVELRPELQQRLSRERSQRGYVEGEIRKLRQTLQAAETSLQQISGQEDADSIQIQQDRIQQLEALIRSTQRLADSKRAELVNQSDAYSIVPYSGDSGTNRRPIYVECTADAIVLQPYGIELHESHFTFPLLPGNPLDATLLAVRQYLNQYELSDGGSAYPLLVVRPGGETNFALARRAMLNWDDEFGYELVEKGKKLAFGEADFQLTEIVKKTVEESLVKQRQMVALLESRGQRFEKIGGQRSFGASTDSASSNQLAGLTSHSSAAGSPTSASNGTANLTRSAAVSRGSADQLRSPAVGFNSSPESPESAASIPGSSPAQGNTRIGQVRQNSGATANSAATLSQTGSNWALPSSSSDGIAFRRPIQVNCHADRLVIIPGEYSKLEEITIRVETRVEESVEEFVHSLWTVIDSWGIAGSNAYWKPVLNVRVQPGGQIHSERLRTALLNSGLEFEQ